MKRILRFVIIFIILTSVVTAGVLFKQNVDAGATARTAVQTKVPVVLVPGTVGSWPKSYLDGMFAWFDKNGFTSPDLASSMVNSYAITALKGMYSKAAGEATKLGIDLSSGKLNAKSLAALKNSKYITYVNDEIYFTEPFTDEYTALLNTLESKYGYEKEKNLFVFGYETVETGISDNGKALQKYVQSILKKTGAKKVRIIAHSQGNLVARSYIQDYSGYDSVEKFIMVAPPNKGVAKCYGMYYYGGPQTAGSKSGLASSQDDILIGLKALMTYGDESSESKTKWVQEHGFSIRDMVPVGLAGFKTPTPPKNAFLEHLNNTAENGYKQMVKKVKVYVLYGSGLSTLSYYENQQGESPQGVSTNCGDGVVARDSALLDKSFTYTEYAGGTHHELMNGKITKAFNRIVELAVK